MPADYSDQTDIFDPSMFADPVHLIGVGGIGSAVLFPLLKLGIREVHLWDPDTVEPHNLPAQLLYRESDLGLPKVDAAAAFAVRQESACIIHTHQEFVTDASEFDGIVISGVDSMRSRRAIWDAVRNNSYLIPLYMDGRIGGEQLQLLTVQPSDFDEAERYESGWLFSDEEASALPCAARTVIHPPTVLAGLIVAQLTLFTRNLKYEPNIMAHLKSTQFVS